MIECARILVNLGIRNVRYLAFDAEEIQRTVESLDGSPPYANSLDTTERSQLAIIFESVGFSSEQ